MTLVDDLNARYENEMAIIREWRDLYREQAYVLRLTLAVLDKQSARSDTIRRNDCPDHCHHTSHSWMEWPGVSFSVGTCKTEGSDV